MKDETKISFENRSSDWMQAAYRKHRDEVSKYKGALFKDCVEFKNNVEGIWREPTSHMMDNYHSLLHQYSRGPFTLILGGRYREPKDIPVFTRSIIHLRLCE